MTDAPGKATFIDRSKTNVGKQSLPNRLAFFKDIKFDWCNNNISEDKLRQEL